jgi:amidase
MLPLLSPAIEIAAGLRDGKFSSRELVEAYAARMDGIGRGLNAVIARRIEAALAEASAADALRAVGRSLGPLHGVPVTVKESFDVAGLASTWGHPQRASHRATRDAVAVSRLTGAGAIVMGKTNVPKDLADWQSFNEVYGVTRNPWDQERSPGGSSGGSATALAAGLTALEIGSDIAGSIRVPASYCGVWGHKPTFGVVPTGGHAMAEGAAPADILVAGPLARSAFDLELAMDLIAGADPDEPGVAGWRLELPAEPRTKASEFRVAILDSDAQFPVDGSIRRALSELGDALSREGATVDREPRLPIGSAEGYELFITLLRGATCARLDDRQLAELTVKARGFDADDRSYDAIMHRGLTQTHHAWLAAHEKRQSLRRAWRAFFERYDALICPVTTTPTFPHMIGVPKIEQFFDVDGAKRPASDCYYWIGIPSLSYLPATSIPIGANPAGLPLGAQIIGPEFADRRCIRLAQIIERSFRGFVAPSAFAG